jgi:hypothetical protein
VEGARPLEHRLVEELLLPLDVGVERALLDAERVGEVADRRAVVALLGEEAGGVAGELLATRRGANVPTLTSVR